MVGRVGAMQPAVAGAGAGLGVAAVGGAVSGGGGGGGALSITFAPGPIVVNGPGAFTEAPGACRLTRSQRRLQTIRAGGSARASF